jgi:hypothetical protein
MNDKPKNVYECIAAVSAEIAKVGISKDRKNEQQGYKFRGIDDVYNVLAPLLAKEGLVIVPRILSRECVERLSSKQTPLFYVTVEAEFDFVSAHDGTKATARSYGEAMDSADKATNKAMSAAYKYAAFQTFCIPTEGDNDADATTHDVEAQPEPHAAPVMESELPPERPRTAPAPRQPVPSTQPLRPGELRVTTAKIAKTGINDKGPWTLYAVKFSDGQEGTTFSKSIFEAAQAAANDGRVVEAKITGTGKNRNLIGLEPIYSEAF